MKISSKRWLGVTVVLLATIIGLLGWRASRIGYRAFIPWLRPVGPPREITDQMKQESLDEVREVQLRLLIRTIGYPDSLTRQAFLEQFYGGDEQALLEDEQELRLLTYDELMQLCDWEDIVFRAYRRHRRAWEAQR